MFASTEPPSAGDRESIVAIGNDPGRLTTLRQADAAFERGRWAEAAALYHALPTDDEEAARYPMRRRCQALTEQGSRSEALSACQALVQRVVPEAADLQSLVAALMLGSGRPSDSDLRQATQLMQKVEGAEPGSVWSEAARCNIAQRVGDHAALGACSARLAQLAPNSRLAKPYAQLAQGEQRGRWLKLGVLSLFGLALLSTLLHRILNGRRAAVVASAALALACWAPTAQAQDTPPANPADNAASSSESQAPQDVAGEINRDLELLQELSEEIAAAEELIKKNEWKEAVNKLVDVVTKAPYFVKGWRRLCEGYGYLGVPVEGAHACRQVLASPENNAWDRAMLVHHLLSGPDGTAAEVRAEAKQLADAAVALAPQERWGYDAQCELALLVDDLRTMQSCTQQLDRLVPDDRKTVALVFSLALREKRFSDAENVIERARAGGMDAPSLERMQRMVDSQRPFLSRLWRAAPLGVGVGVGVGVLVLLIRFLLSRRSRTARGAVSLTESRATK
ncbi:MAG: hypothetical protein K0R38_3824 [Polyangiaceae bacterium]|jgi:hypothetical protein|nr:hypothetical protein [Polyangiaceae bacterium]